MKIKIKDLEKKLNKPIKKNWKAIGWDTAEKCGIGFISSDNKEVTINWCYLEFDNSNIKNVYSELNSVAKEFMGDKYDYCVIEDTFLRFFGRKAQANVMKKLTRFGGIILAKAIDTNTPYDFIGAKSARAKLFKLDSKKYKGKSKQAVFDYLVSIGIEINEDNCADGVLLALLGMIDEMDFRSNAEIAKSKKKKKAKK